MFLRGRKGQFNIDYLGGFAAFSFGIILIGTLIISNLPLYSNEIQRNAQRTESWVVSEGLMRHIENGGMDLDPDLIRSTNIGCSEYSYNDVRGYRGLRDAIGVSVDHDFRISVTQYPLIITDTPTAGGLEGSIVLDGRMLVVEAIRDGDGVHSTVLLNGNPPEAGDKFSTRGLCANEPYSPCYIVHKIDPDGAFVMLERVALDCGPPVSTSLSVSPETRFSTLDGQVARIETQYW